MSGVLAEQREMRSSILGSKLLQLKYRIEKDLQLDSVWVG